MRVLVTGHRGYIGSVLTPMLRAAGHEVVGLDSGLFERCALGPLPEGPAIDRDIRDALASDLSGFDAVVHLAGLSNDPLGNLDPALTDDINHKGTMSLARLAKRAGIGRFVYASSCSVYGAAGDSWLDENATFNPLTPYAVSKLASERGLLAMMDDGFSPSFLRAGTAYGLSPMIRFDLVLNNLAAWAAATGSVRLKSDGSAWRPLVHVEDIAAAYRAVLEAPRETVAGEAFNVGSSAENFRVRELAEILESVFDDCRIEFAQEASADVRCYRVTCDKLSATLPDYRPRWDVRRGAAQLRDLLIEQQIAVAAFEGPRYQRLAHLQELMEQGSVDASLRWLLPLAAGR